MCPLKAALSLEACPRAGGQSQGEGQCQSPGAGGQPPSFPVWPITHISQGLCQAHSLGLARSSPAWQGLCWGLSRGACGGVDMGRMVEAACQGARAAG